MPEQARKTAQDAKAYSNAALGVAALALLVALVASITVAAVARQDAQEAERSARVARMVAADAKATAANAKTALAAYKALGAQRRETLAKINESACESRHILVMVMSGYVTDSVKSQKKILNSPIAKQLGVAELQRKSIARSERFLAELAKADCTGVPPLTPAKPKGR